MTPEASARSDPSAGDFRRGACPTLSVPMPTGDGLLARLRPLDCAVTTGELRAIAAAAAEFGNGIIEVTARGSLQIRGLKRETVRPFERAVLASGIVPASGVMVEVPPLAGIDPDEIVDVRPLAHAIRDAVEARRPPLVLAPKLAVTVDGGGRFHLGGVTADIRLTAVGGAKFLLAVGGTNRSARPVAVVRRGQAVEAVIRVLEQIAKLGVAARGKDIDVAALDGLYDPAASDVLVCSDTSSFLGVHCLNGSPPSVLPDISPSRGETGWRTLPASREVHNRSDVQRDRATTTDGAVTRDECHESLSPLVGEMSGRTEGGIPDTTRKGSHVLGIALPYRQAKSSDLIAFLDALEKLDVSEIRLAPGHGFFITGLTQDSASQAEASARQHGFWTSPNEPRANIALCSGTSGCASAFFDTGAIAETLLSAAPELLDGSLAVHLSGCVKGCAHSAAAPLTLVGAPSGYGLVVNGAASASPAHYIAAKDLGIALERLASLVAGAKEACETARACLARLGAETISAALQLD